ncbi:uncharacterized protein LOC105157827 [Sesamum indicum]|uniref:Uncharacterized protein LOC105157827 n=1 Tax=Sesamum indicum TaxID=4182 RepID=A0A6I9SQS4_SESIN|nr:uncharacterized protein LOC105157827 [Sesamum indicum]
MHALKLREESTFQIRQYNPTHKCARSFNVKNVNSKWLSTKYEDAFRTDSKRNVKGFRKDVIKELRCHVSRNQTYRAKQKAIDKIEGKVEDQFDCLWDYAWVHSDDGCRPVIGVDGCHLKGLYGGVLLTAISIDPNNNLYLAYAVVSGETREAWQWFFELLKDNLHIVRDDTYTFISDKQKGLIPAFECVFPGADNRFCVRHLYGNMKTAGFRGLPFKKALWSAAKATIVSEFNFRMEEFAKLDPKLVEWLSDKPPAHWSRAYLIVFQKPKDFVNPCYSVATFIEVYKNAILPVNGPNLWEKSGLIPCLPPNFGRGAGRLARARRLEYDKEVHKKIHEARSNETSFCKF